MDKQTNQQKTIPAQSGSGTCSSTTPKQASGSAASLSPLQRWQSQTAYEEPWNAVGEVKMKKMEKKESVRQAGSTDWSITAEQGSQS